MLRTLDSGLQIQDQLYYETLEWIGKNPIKWNKFCDSNEIPNKRRSLNRFTEEEYDLLIEYSK